MTPVVRTKAQKEHERDKKKMHSEGKITADVGHTSVNKQTRLSRGLENRHPLRRVAEEEGVVEPRHDVPAPLRDLEHLAQLVRVARQ